MTTRSTRTGDDGKRNAHGESPADLEERAKDGNADSLTHAICGGQGKRRNGCYSSKDVEEHTRRLGHHFSQDPRPLVLEHQLPLGHRLWRDDMTRDMTLEHIRDTEFEFVRMLSRQGVRVVAIGLRHGFDEQNLGIGQNRSGEIDVVGRRSESGEVWVRNSNRDNLGPPRKS